MSQRSDGQELLAAALIGTARGGGQAGALLDSAAAHALRARAGVALVRVSEPGAGPVKEPAPVEPAPVGPVKEPAPVDRTPLVGPAAAARAGDLLAFDNAGRAAGPVRDVAGRLELLAEWLAEAASAGRRLPPELVPALLDAGRRHHLLRPLIAPVAGPLAGWLAAQRQDWGYASAAPPAAPAGDDAQVWELGTLARRVAYLTRLRGHDPARARELLSDAWPDEPPEARAALIGALGTGLGEADEVLLERALDDRRRQVRDLAAELLGRLAGSGYARRMAGRARAYVDLSVPGRIGITPPAECDRAMRRDGIVARPPAGVGERAWWLEEVVARTPLGCWPEPGALLTRAAGSATGSATGSAAGEQWLVALRRGLARAAAAQRDVGWAAALVDPLTAEVAESGRPDDRLLLESLYDVLPPADLAERAAAVLRRGLTQARAVGVEQVLALCPRPWPPAVAGAVFAAFAEHAGHRAAGWRLAGLAELAGLRLPAEFAPRAAELARRLREQASPAYPEYPSDPGAAVVDRLATTLKYRHDMLKELA